MTTYTYEESINGWRLDRYPEMGRAYKENFNTKLDMLHAFRHFIEREITEEESKFFCKTVKPL